MTSTFTSFQAPLGERYVSLDLVRGVQAPAEEGGLGSETRFTARWFSTLPDTFDNQVRDGCCIQLLRRPVCVKCKLQTGQAVRSAL